MIDITLIIVTILSSSVIVSIINAISSRRKMNADVTSIIVDKALQSGNEARNNYKELYEAIKNDYADKCAECDRYEQRIAEYQEQISYYTSLLAQHGISFRRFGK